MAAGLRRILVMGGVVAGVGLVALGVALMLTWPDNALGDYLQIRRSQAATVRALARMAAAGTDPLRAAFYAAWLAEENGDLRDAIRRFRAVSDAAPPGSRLRRDALIRLGLVYGQDGQADAELAIYQELMRQYPGASRLSQALFHLRRGERARARALLDQALDRDARDGSLGADRELARVLRRGLGPEEPAAVSH
ncbi:MAG TPA: tetratricopeptide repeat protein [Candidatus Sulfotelmatobacter sp.]|nr:tetratricopeptide repeat protein [Candidatus Sulfotelmatobacter sp.]